MRPTERSYDMVSRAIFRLNLNATPSPGSNADQNGAVRFVTTPERIATGSPVVRPPHRSSNAGSRTPRSPL
jgi:hypothetical protein